MLNDTSEEAVSKAILGGLLFFWLNPYLGIDRNPSHLFFCKSALFYVLKTLKDIVFGKRSLSRPYFSNIMGNKQESGFNFYLMQTS